MTPAIRSKQAANVYLYLQHVEKLSKTTLNSIINVAAEEQTLCLWNTDVRQSLGIISVG